MNKQEKIQPETAKHQDDDFCRLDALVGMPFYNDGQIKIYNGNSESVLPQLDEKFNMILTDPPYEIEDMEEYFEMMKRSLYKNGSMYVFGNKNTIAERWFGQLRGMEKDLLIWHYKNSPKPKGRWRGSMQAIIYGYKNNSIFNEDPIRTEYLEATKKLNGRTRPSSGRYNENLKYDTSKGALPKDVLECPALLGHLAKKRYGHRDQKPIELIERLVLASSALGGSILDPFMGTGTTLVAAKKQGRRATGIEINKHWCEVAAKRLNEFNLFQ